MWTRERQRKKHMPANQEQWESSKRYAEASQGPKSEEEEEEDSEEEAEEEEEYEE